MTFAARAGIALRTYKRFESEGQASLETFLRVLTALERTHSLQLLFPAPPPPKPPTLIEKVAALAAKARGRTPKD